MNNLYDYLVDSIESLSICINEDEIHSMKRFVIIGSNREEEIKKFVNIVHTKNPDVQIVVLMQEGMYSKLYNIHDDEKIILCNEKYSVKDADRILKEIRQEKIDGFFFVGRNKDDLGNLNILEIADYIQKYNNNNLYVYGVDFNGDVYMYKDIAMYIKGLKLYNDINDFIDEVSNNR
ncbi:MAG: hypothetical protein ACI4D0_07870 [Lachnospira sp.]